MEEIKKFAEIRCAEKDDRVKELEMQLHLAEDAAKVAQESADLRCAEKDAVIEVLQAKIASFEERVKVKLEGPIGVWFWRDD